MRHLSDICGNPAYTHQEAGLTVPFRERATSLIRERIVAAALLLACPVAASSALHAQVVPWRTQIAASPDAQTLPEDRGADGLAQTLRKLDSRASLMMIVAHPDDEDGGMLALESRGLGTRTAILTLTRGEGGQNAMSADSYDALGLIRTNELLLADQYSGTEQYFSRVADYGFSKTIEEAHQQWGHDRVLYDVVHAIRLYRPLVLTSVFTGNITDGHGHHQVSGEMAQEAFKAAGDPSVFPDQIAAGLLPWSPLKVYERVPGFSIGPKGIFDYATNKWAPVRFYNYVDKQWSDTVPTANIEIPEGTRDPLLGESYLQIAREGWSMQKSQYGGGTPLLPGPFTVSYHRYGSLVPTTEKESSFFDGIDTSLAGIASLAHSGDTASLVAALNEIHQHVAAATAAYSPSAPAKIAPDLAAGYRLTQQLIATVNGSSLSAPDKTNIVHELTIKLAQFNTALAEALGLEVNALVTPRTDIGATTGFPSSPAEMPTTVSPGSQIDVRVHVTAAEPWGPSPEGLQLARTWLENPDGDHWPVTRIGSPGLDTAFSLSGDAVFHVEVPHNAQLTRPYFTRPDFSQPYYDIGDPKLLNLPFGPWPLAGWAEFHYQGATIRLGQVVQTVHRVHGIGGVYQPLAVLPQLSVSFAASAGVVPEAQENAPVPLTVTVRNNEQDNTDGDVHLNLPQGWTSDPAEARFHLASGAAQAVTFTLHPTALDEKAWPIQAVAHTGNYDFSEAVDTVGYPGLKPYYLYRPATYRLRAVDVKTAPGIRVGYVMGTGDDVPEALSAIGVPVHLLTDAELASGDLSHYDAIVVGIRAYSSRPELFAASHRLMEYVHNGGTMLVQYQSNEFPAPYPLTLGRNPEKVVNEHDPVTLLDPASPLFAWPNHITAADFDNWVEERGHSFLSSWASQYTPLTETHDPGQDPQRGGLLVAHEGRGTYIYLSFAVYRQLPEAVPGAYRLLANLISASKQPARH
ncbi:PIG-L family deacetylase [Paracidobacterium acidisoli]|uniref:PIG-L family deacetylase n=1 Tax=Paracidobacterium acidisoli TaxID=2303751 RepID=UPI0018F26277|nr:PIG-L family deacetylase [Paracidobacterium acidisoli]